MKFFLIAVFLFAGFASTVATAQRPAGSTGTTSKPVISIVYPKHDQRVRGPIRIYGKAKPGAVVKVKVSSTYFKTDHKNERISKGEGPLKRMNRSFTLTADRSGVWQIKSIELTNAGWEENFTIKASSEGMAVFVNVYDHTKPVRID